MSYVLSVLNLLVLIATVYYIAHAPVNAVRIGRELNTDTQKDNAKRSLFLSLFSLRGTPIHHDFVRGLNRIAVVFEDVPSVLSAWHLYFDSLQIKNQANAELNWSIQRTNLLSAMAVHLGYESLNQTEMMRDYYPEGHDNYWKDENQLREIQKKYFDKQGLLAEMLIQKMNDQDKDKADETASNH